MTRIAILSDIHTELQKISDYSFLDPTDDSEDPIDILVMAGDLGSPKMAYESYLTLLHEASIRYTHVLMVPGNNEFKEGSYQEVINILEQMSRFFHNIHLLNRSHITINNIMFVGATLWSPVVGVGMVNPLIDPAIPIDQREHLHRLDVRYLETMLKSQPDRSVVIITHHPPIESFRERDILTSRVMKKTPIVLASRAYYVNNLENMVDRSRAWICGHVHVQWMDKVNETPIILNAMGTLNENLDRRVRTLTLP